MESTIEALNHFFNEKLIILTDTYEWKIPKIKGFKHSGKKGYSYNVELKQFLNSLWIQADSKEKEEIVKIIVSDWGGVRGNKDETLHSYISESEKEIPNTPLKGIASYSKVFSIMDMNKYAIYDARVAACLNAVQINYGLDDGLAFNYVSGRNNIIGNVIKKIGFVYEPNFTIKSLVERGWSKIKKDDTYETYLNLLNKCLESFPDNNLYDLEMALFSNAELECSTALNSVHNRYLER